MTAMLEKKKLESHPPARDAAKEMLLRNTMDVLRAFMECSDEIQHGVLEMAQILNDSNADEDQKAAAAETLIEALYPKYHGEELGMDSAAYETWQCENEPDLEKAMDEEEATFSENLARLMEARGVTQDRLANTAGVGQSAISMMLARNCRPQRRTVEKMAKALGVKPDELWPGHQPKQDHTVQKK